MAERADQDRGGAALGFAIAAIGIDTVSGSVRLTMGHRRVVEGVNSSSRVMGCSASAKLVAVDEEVHAPRTSPRRSSGERCSARSAVAAA